MCAIHALQHSLHLFAVGSEHLHLFAYIIDVLLRHLEGLPDTGRAHLQLIVAQRIAQFFLHIAAQRGTVFYPHAIGMVYLHDDAVVAAENKIHQKIVVALQPLFYSCSNYALVNHIFFGF